MAFALLLVAGGAMVFAGGGLNAPPPKSGSNSSAAPLPAPLILTPDVTLTRATTIDLTLTRPSGLNAGTSYTLRITDNDTKTRDEPLPEQEQFVVAGIPLSEGANSLRALLVDGAGAGASSPALIVTRDTTAPVIQVTDPAHGAPVYAQIYTLRGKTEAGATMSVTDLDTSTAVAATVAADGHFTSDLTLNLGDNQLELSSTDPAGNSSTAHITIVVANTQAEVTLTISGDALKADGHVNLADLPVTLSANAVIQDERGQPVDGAQVTFSLSPPNATTLTYKTTSVAGTATWPELDIASVGDPHGTWLITVLAVLPSGTELRQNKAITVR